MGRSQNPWPEHVAVRPRARRYSPRGSSRSRVTLGPEPNRQKESIYGTENGVGKQHAKLGQSHRSITFSNWRPQKTTKKGHQKNKQKRPQKTTTSQSPQSSPWGVGWGWGCLPQPPPLMGYENVFYYKHSMMFQMLLSSLFCEKMLFFFAKSNQAVGFCHANHTLFEAPQGHSITTKGPFYNVQWVHFPLKTCMKT